MTLAKYTELQAEMTQLKAQFIQQLAKITQQWAETAAIKNQFSAMTQENACIKGLLEQPLEQRTRHLDNLVPQQQEATTPSTDINRHNMRDLYNKLSNSAPKFFTPLMQLALGPNKMAVGNCSGGSQHQAHDNEVFQHGWKVTYRMFRLAEERLEKMLKECKIKCDATGRNTRSTQGYK